MLSKLECLLTLFILAISLYAPVKVNAQTYGVQEKIVELTITTDKQVYSFGEIVQISGNLTVDGSPVNDGLVALQVEDSAGYLLCTRTLDTGTTPSNNWIIEILQVITTDGQGNPKDTFKIGETVNFEVTLRNNGQTPYEGWITVTILDAAMIPQGVPRVQGTFPTGTSNIMLSIPVSSTATLGTATAYTNAYTKQPKDGGTPYCPEKTASFTITTSSTTSSQSQHTPQSIITTLGFYDFTFRLYKDYVRMGNYTATASSQYEIIYFAVNSTKFEVVLKGDVNDDNTVDIFDCVIVALAFGASPGDANWDSRADINNDNLVDIFDLVVIALDFGKTARQ